MKKIILAVAVLFIAVFALFAFLGKGGISGLYSLSHGEKSAAPLFDISVTIPKSYAKIMYDNDEDEHFLFYMQLTNLGLPGRADVFLDYWIIGPDNKKVYSSRETVAVETKASFTREVNLPQGLKEGAYSVFAKVSYGINCIKSEGSDCQYAVANAPFLVVSGGENGSMQLVVAFIFLSALAIAMLFVANPKLKQGIMQKIKAVGIRENVHKIVQTRQKKGMK